MAPRNSKDGAQTNSINVTWELVNNADYRSYPRTTKSELVGMTKAFAFNKASSDSDA